MNKTIKKYLVIFCRYCYSYLQQIHLFLRSIFLYAVNVIAALFFAILFSPLIATTAYRAKKEFGKILFAQKRVGKDGKEFNMYKFPSMLPSTKEVPEWLTGTQLQQFESYRETEFGTFIRKTKIDELPQLINVLKGQMAIIGQRAQTKRELDVESCFYAPWYGKKPGMTGLSQTAKCKKDPHFRVKHAGMIEKIYFEKQSVVLNCIILFQTAALVYDSIIPNKVNQPAKIILSEEELAIAS